MVDYSDIRCGRCGRQLSSSGREIGLTVWDPAREEDGRWKGGQWITVCAMSRCARIPMDVTVGELQNFWLNQGG